MAELKPETKIERLAEKMRPLADWFAKNKPSVTVLRVPADDLKLLSDNPGPAVHHGFHIDNGAVKWRGFEIRSA